MPSRFLRPEIRSSRRWNACSWCGQSLYIRLITLVDDYGRYEADPVILCSEAFPTFRHFRPSKVRKLLVELAANDLIRLYQHDGKTYLHLTRWKERVRITQSKFPAPNGGENEHANDENARKQAVSQMPLRADAAQTSGSLPPPPYDSVSAFEPSRDATLNAPTTQHVQEYFDKLNEAHGTNYTAAEARQVFLSFEATKDEHGRWHSWNNRPVSDWRAAVEERANFFRSKQKGTYDSNKPFGQQRPDRNKGTYNEGKAHLYAKTGSGI
jgi:hypothetical protein